MLWDPISRRYVVAELSANHRQKLDVALALIRAAEAIRVDASSLQTYTPETITGPLDPGPI